jgi:hypothetical protein
MSSVWYDACAGEVWTEGGFTMALFQGWGVGSEVLFEQVQPNFSFRNKFIILLPCGLLVDNNTFLKNVLSKLITLIMVVMKTEMRFLIIIKSKVMKSLCWLF